MFNRKFSESDLIQGCIRNERKWQERLYKHYFDTMYAMVLKHSRNSDFSLEILNSGFLKVFQKIETFRNEGSFEGWMRRLIYNTMVDFFKRENRYHNFIILSEEDGEKESSSIENIYLEELLEMINDLPDATARVFKLYAIEGYNHKEIGELLKISEGTSKWHLSEARKKLKIIFNNNQNYKRG